MAKKHVELYVAVKIAPSVVHEAARRVMESIGKRTSPYNKLTLAVDFRQLHVAPVGEVQVPIRASVDSWPQRWECGLEIQASARAQFFPKFVGRLIVNPNGTEAELWLRGYYEPPLGVFGAALNATVLRGAAARSLGSFLQWVADAIKRDALEHERQYAQSVRSAHG